MKNNSSGPVHLWLNNESMDPSNKVDPGSSRTAMMPWIQRDGEPVVEMVNLKGYAGSNGEVITSIVVEVKVQKTSAVRVVYSDGTLSKQ